MKARMAAFTLVALLLSGRARAQRASNSATVHPDVKPYSLARGFAGVANYNSFSKAFRLSPEQKRLLTKNLFVVAPGGDAQLYDVYANNDYANLPSFVTADSVLQLYHVFYNSTLRNVEQQSLLPKLKKLADGMVRYSISQSRTSHDANMRQAALYNAAYFGVAARLLGSSAALPAGAQRLAAGELSHIDRHEGPARSSIFPYELDYSQFAVRGHYAKSEALTHYFKAMMWFGLAPVALEQKQGGTPALMQARQALLFSSGLRDTTLRGLWDDIYSVTSLYSGTSDGLTPFDCRRAADEVFGASATAPDSPSAAKLGEFVQAAKKLAHARIQSRQHAGLDLPETEVQVRFMGQRYIPDSEILQRLSGDDRIFPTGLDVMAVLGSARAKAILDAHPDRYNPKDWPDYVPERDKLSQEFSNLTPAQWHANLYTSWLNCLRALFTPVGDGYPSFMRNSAWEDKSLQTGLASWTELRHDTILYGKQSAAEMGDGDVKPFVPGYVEPNILFFDRLISLTQQSRAALQQRHVLPKDIGKNFAQFEDLLSFLRSVSARELTNRPITRKEHERIRFIEGDLSEMTDTLLRSGTNFVALSDDDLDMSLIADVHTGQSQALEEGVGHSYELIAVVPIAGKLYLARGSVFSYYEFKQPIANRMGDAQWKRRVNDGKAPAAPVWISSFFTPSGGKDLSR